MCGGCVVGLGLADGTRIIILAEHDVASNLYVVIVMIVLVVVEIVRASISLIVRDVGQQGGRDTSAAGAGGIARLLSASVALWDKTIRMEGRE